jgi:DNA-binding NtrC family response regulator
MAECARILIVDDEGPSLMSMGELLSLWGHEITTAVDGQQALRKAIESHPDVIITDLVMPNMDGFWLLRALKDELPDSMVVFLTGRGTIDAAVNAIKEGADDFVEKPVDPARLQAIIARALQRRETIREVNVLRGRLRQLSPGIDLIGGSPAMTRVYALVKKVAPLKTCVSILGESGTGKEVVARALHDLSPRKEKPFVALNCSAIPATLIESELFGYERGAFTGADQRRLGCFELAHTGTLFLDEIGELPLDLQAKFLRVLEDSRVRRLGARAEIPVDVRIICATNRDMKDLIRAGKFREDLFFRLHVFQIPLPPLKDRVEDIPLLIRHFIDKFNAETGKRVQNVSDEALEVLRSYPWPGNIRELRNAIERALILVEGTVIEVEHLPPDFAAHRPVGSIAPYRGRMLKDVEKEHILATLRENGGNKAKTAYVLGISEKTLYNKLDRYAESAASRVQVA